MSQVLTRLYGFSTRPARSFRDYLSLYRQRRALERLDAHILRDIGITRHQALSEANRQIWDAPSHWC